MLDLYNVRHPAILELVDQLNDIDDNTFVQRAFDFVRDRIEYQWMLNWTVAAEQTLELRKGNCFTKSSLLWTLISSRSGIPVEFLVATIPVEGFVGRMAPDWVWKHFPSLTSPHAAIQVYLNDKWIILDPTVDTKLARGMAQFGNPNQCFSFDGSGDAMNPAFADMKHQRCKDIDFLLYKKPTYESGLVSLVEGCSYFLRHEVFGKDGCKPLFGTPQQLQLAMESYLLSNCPGITTPMATLPPSFLGNTTTPTITNLEYCNPYHPKIQALASRFWKKSKSDREFVRCAFEWVRDKIPYVLQSDWSVPVEHTLTIRKGMCSTKSCLLTSILRSGGFEAGFYVQPTDAHENFVAPKWICDHYSRRSVHILSAVYLDNRWIKLDVFVDKLLGTSMLDANLGDEQQGFSRVAEFPVDGQEHHALSCDEGVYGRFSSPMKFCNNIDAYMDKTSRIPPVVLQCHNICLELLRKMGPMFHSREEVLHAMEQHLDQFYPHLVAQAKQPRPTDKQSAARAKAHTPSLKINGSRMPMSLLPWATTHPGRSKL